MFLELLNALVVVCFCRKKALLDLLANRDRLLISLNLNLNSSLRKPTMYIAWFVFTKIRYAWTRTNTTDIIPTAGGWCLLSVLPKDNVLAWRMKTERLVHIIYHHQAAHLVALALSATTMCIRIISVSDYFLNILSRLMILNFTSYRMPADTHQFHG